LFEIDDLQRMITNPADIRTLEMLDDDKITPRSQIQQQINEIVARQPQSVQNAYNMIVQNDRAKEEAELRMELQELRMRGASTAVLNAKQKLYDIENDLSLSEMQADQQKMQVKSSLSVTDYMMLESD
uniref:Sodium:proton antiporter n=1 Tax=Toxocara canis TaxID=6265 RepID=A0A183V784_TOXCA